MERLGNTLLLCSSYHLRGLGSVLCLRKVVLRDSVYGKKKVRVNTEEEGKHSKTHISTVRSCCILIVKFLKSRIA